MYPFEEIIIRDEDIHHCKPFKYTDFLYSKIRFDIHQISEEHFVKALKVSGSISYDPLKKEIRARCDSEAANIATLYLAIAVA